MARPIVIGHCWARGRFVRQIADDELWLPNHLQELEQLLADFEFGLRPSIEITPDGVRRIAPD
ncbi:hypothetical protein ABTE14_19460, partial [Acinetobacter baumannii]